MARAQVASQYDEDEDEFDEDEDDDDELFVAAPVRPSFLPQRHCCDVCWYSASWLCAWWAAHQPGGHADTAVLDTADAAAGGPQSAAMAEVEAAAAAAAAAQARAFPGQLTQRNMVE